MILKLVRLIESAETGAKGTVSEIVLTFDTNFISRLFLNG